jgi:hypothetical protein
MLIHIISGTYGYCHVNANGIRSVTPVDRFSDPIDVDEAEAKRLVELGVAEYVNAAPPVLAAADPTFPEESGAEDADTSEVPEDSGDEDLESLSFNELKEIAKGLGIETGKIRSKAAMINEIILARTAQDDSFPVLDVAEEVEEE